MQELANILHFSAVKSDCSGLQAGYYVCIGVAGSTTVTTTTTAAPTTATPTTTSSPYSPQQTGITKDCMCTISLAHLERIDHAKTVLLRLILTNTTGNKYYFVQKDDSCAGIAAMYSISLTDFYNWNPAVGSSCGSLLTGYYVCVGISGTSLNLLVLKLLSLLSNLLLKPLKEHPQRP
jgi:LysM domain.